MTLKRLTDFSAKPAWWEYFIFYMSTLGAILLLGMAVRGELPFVWIWFALMILIVTVALFGGVYTMRSRRSRAFFLEWLSTFDNQQLECLKVRLANNNREHRIIDEVLSARSSID